MSIALAFQAIVDVMAKNMRSDSLLAVGESDLTFEFSSNPFATSLA